MTYYCATFRTETDAVRFERAALARGLPGRLAPAPRALSVSCGLCWLAPEEAESAVLTLLLELEVDFGTAGPVEWRTRRGLGA